VPQLFAVSDWVALPYARHFTSQSGVLNIAAHYRRPVLTSDAPVLAETVRRHDIGVVCEGDDPAAIAAGLDRLLDRLRAGHRHDFEAYEVAHSWEENARRTAAVYRQLLEEQ
jgi:glycosyltransferase involved in cell wall biosynthesis